MFIDASAAVAVLAREPCAARVMARVADAPAELCYSPFSRWETVVAVARLLRASTLEANEAIDDWFQKISANCIDITEEISIAALRAHARYGKRSGHPARLNMGDCFAYACAKSAGVPLLYVGDDFSHTDLALED